jgi:hypothetical protein
VIEPDDGIVAIGSGAPYATAAAKALLAHTELSAREVVEAAMTIAAEICIFTNDRFVVEYVGAEGAEGAEEIDELPMPSLLPSGLPDEAEVEDEEEEEAEREAAREVEDEGFEDDEGGDGDSAAEGAG